MRGLKRSLILLGLSSACSTPAPPVVLPTLPTAPYKDSDWQLVSDQVGALKTPCDFTNGTLKVTLLDGEWALLAVEGAILKVNHVDCSGAPVLRTNVRKVSVVVKADELKTLGVHVLIDQTAGALVPGLRFREQTDTEPEIRPVAAVTVSLRGNGIGTAPSERESFEKDELWVRTTPKNDTVSFVAGATSDAGALSTARLAVPDYQRARDIEATGLRLLALFGDTGDDVVDASSAPFTLRLFGGPGQDTLLGGAGADMLDGGPGADRLLGGGGDDDLWGDDGDDVLDGGPGCDFADGGEGDDFNLDAAAALRVVPVEEDWAQGIPACTRPSSAVVTACKSKFTSAPESDGTSADTVEQCVGDKSVLVWQRDLVHTWYDWAEAKAYCDTLDLDGAQDWRLPTMFELWSLTDHTRANPAIDQSYFPLTPSDFFWSATPGRTPDLAWYVSFGYGRGVDYGGVAYGGNVRCVRGPTKPKVP